MFIEFKKKIIHTEISRVLARLEVVTKRLKVMLVKKGSEAKKVVISSKELEIAGMPVGTKIVGGVNERKNALEFRVASFDDKKVRTISYRNYKNRDYVEPVLDIRNQAELSLVIGNAEHVHVTFKKGIVIIKPIFDVVSLDVHAQVKAIHPDHDGLYTDVLSVIELVNEKRFACLSIEADSEFQGSRECLLMVLQLRRLGYNNISHGKDLIVARRQFDMGSKIQVVIPSEIAIPTSPILINHNDLLSTFTVCTGGVDVYAMRKEGFTSRCLLEYRPPEVRDYATTVSKVTGDVNVRFNDKTDTGALCAALNSPDTKVLFNEDIYSIDENMVAGIVGKVNHLSGALQCDDFSCLKNANDRAKAIASLDTTVDMFFNVLRILKPLNPPTLLMENVRNFANSVESKLLSKGLERLGYKVTLDILHAKDYNGNTNRERAFLFATKLDAEFAFPSPVVKTAHAWDDVVSHKLDEMRDLTHTKTVSAGIEQNRIRYISEGDALAPTIVRSQSKQTKDAVYIKMDDRYYLPNNSITKALMGIGEDFNLAPFSNEISCEIIGQSIEVPMHQMISESIKVHIMEAIRKTVKLAVPEQLSLFA